MMSLAILLFFLLLLLYTYILYPLQLKRKAHSKSFNYACYTTADELPHVHIVIPACNEEKVIGQKLNSIFSTAYPVHKLTVYVGLDACTDNTKAILNTSFNRPEVQVVEFSERQGKPALLNQIVKERIKDDAESILILTDANVFFTTDTIFELVKYFKDERIGLVDSNIVPQLVTNTKEKEYWNYETEIKLHESIVYGIIPGPSGGCYAIRTELFTPVPDNYLVDDFFIGFSVVVKKFSAIINTAAICHEDVVTSWKQEFLRKTRIAAGNFQNLWYFKHQAAGCFSTIGFVFCSHKILRWKTPFFLLIIYYILLLECTLFSLIVTLFLPLIDGLLFTFGLEFKPLRRFSYFILMNIAVFIGFLKFCKGIKSNVWQPTTRT
jgi:cellulose synthase/poly-beta-1,6-N-acetylglucosamine synthase-like glycosyltransferase